MELFSVLAAIVPENVADARFDDGSGGIGYIGIVLLSNKKTACYHNKLFLIPL